MEMTPVPVWVVEKKHGWVVTVAGFEVSLESNISREVVADMICHRIGCKHYGIMYFTGKCELKEVLE